MVRVALSLLLIAGLQAPVLKVPTEYRMLLLFDISGSMTPPSGLVADIHDRWLAEIGRALDDFGKGLTPADHVCLGTVASQIKIAPKCSSGGPSDLVTLFKTLDQRGSPSPLGSAVWSGVEMMRANREAGVQDTIVLVSDGLTSGNQHRTSDVAAFAKQNGVTVHTVMTRPALWATSSGQTMERAFALLKQLAEQTGGTATHCERSGSRFDCEKPKGGLATVFSRMSSEAHSKVDTPRH